ncbi:uncharacterized protein LOC8076993 isoform X1 [Sorghum bicolor]|uniref:Ubiquitin-like protease family profile domain-containing protein n=1 Tax=Sorghum bicolor TaxID=4558 RepID=A0A1Z5R349_SORBI|nr:uncharacterized protein LOC8076993 isoform X1 [Sorghum bicolor]OQU78177.1 hypothetical protein SORBI_3009G172200 [Sorghum bicolor]|eukprot:XP_021302693.1 uncharacterized protein LOC8076993 isoform X1 [Sorghum bicolor]
MNPSLSAPRHASSNPLNFRCVHDSIGRSICSDSNSAGCMYAEYPRTAISDQSSMAVSQLTDTGSVASRCSVRLIHEVVSTFGSQKKELVRAVGFQGLLYFPSLKQINLRFSAWLMSRVDESSQTILIGDGTCIHFDKDDIAKVFGIPVGGMSIVRTGSKRSVSDGTSPESSGHINLSQLRSIKAAQAILLRECDGLMSLSEQAEFKAAFVVFVMASLFAPCGKHDRVSEDYMHAIVNPGNIKSYDWADFVLRRLLSAVSKLKADLSSNVKTPYIYGCSLFLQVLYLDSVDLGSLSMAHTTLPRVRCFSYDRLRAMIAADSSFVGSFVNSHGTSIAAKLRSPDLVCYHWATCIHGNGRSCNQDTMLELWELSSLMTRVMKIPNEAAGPIFVAVSDFERQISSTHFQQELSSASGSLALKMLSLIFHIIEPYANGFRYQPSTSAACPHVGLCRSWHSESVRSQEAPLLNQVSLKRKFSSCFPDDILTSGGYRSPITRGHDTNQFALTKQPVYNDIDESLTACKAMARFLLRTRSFKEVRCSDLNVPHMEDQYVSHVSPHSPRVACSVSRSPWDLGCSYLFDRSFALELSKKIAMLEDSDQPWIVHYCPKYIEVRTSAVKAQFLGKAEFEMELVDAVLRRFKQFDDCLYVNEGSLRWRHYVECDFMVSLLAGSFDVSDTAVSSLFCGSHITYDVTSCKIFFFPALLQHRWVCFAWRISDNTIVVYDPYYSSSCRTFTTAYYQRVANILKSAMSMVSRHILNGWRHPWDDARLEIFYHGQSQITSCNRSGVLCLHFCRSFDGTLLRGSVDLCQVQDLSALLLADVSSLVDNLGSAPSTFSQMLAVPPLVPLPLSNFVDA